ncbi:MAG: hypothetical protein K2I38_06395, partial [Duncaniella sp.]|nr:hypothetical protein [Duncaniella sp.]
VLRAVSFILWSIFGVMMVWMSDNCGVREGVAGVFCIAKLMPSGSRFGAIMREMLKKCRFFSQKKEYW